MEAMTLQVTEGKTDLKKFAGALQSYGNVANILANQ